MRCHGLELLVFPKGVLFELRFYIKSCNLDCCFYGFLYQKRRVTVLNLVPNLKLKYCFTQRRKEGKARKVKSPSPLRALPSLRLCVKPKSPILAISNH